MDGIWRNIGGSIELIFNEIVFCHHFNIRVICIDPDWASQCDSHRAITGEKSPPDPLPESLVWFAEL